jgi:hypothetical protein
MSPDNSEKPAKDFSLLAGFILALVVVHFLFILAFLFVFLYEVKPLLSLSEKAWDFWLCQPIFIAICVIVARNTSRVFRTLVFIDLSLSVLQQASVFLLYAIADKIG